MITEKMMIEWRSLEWKGVGWNVERFAWDLYIVEKIYDFETVKTCDKVLYGIEQSWQWEARNYRKDTENQKPFIVLLATWRIYHLETHCIV